MSKGIEIILRDSAGTVMASLTDLQVAWFDNDTVLDLDMNKCKTVTATTDGTGLLKLNLDSITGLDTGEWGFLLVYKPHATDYKQSPVFAGRMQITTVTGGTDMYALSQATWVRNPEWLALPDVTGLQKFAGLFAVYPDSNFVALSAEGNFIVNWGDGSGDTNVSSGVTAERNIAWADADETSEVGIASAVAVTFTDSGDTVNRTAHGFSNGQEVSFASITSTTGISTYTRYWVVNTAANTFQVASTVDGTALTLTTDGSGTVYVPQYRQVLITVVPNASNITKFDLHIKHSQSGLVTGVNVAWLDIVMSAQYMTDLRLGSLVPGGTQSIRLNDLERFGLLSSDLRQLNTVLSNCRMLRVLSAFESSTITPSSAACTFTDVGDLVTQVGHGFRNGDTVIFTTVTTTTGILKSTSYFVRDVSSDTYTVSATYNGSVMSLTTDGSGIALLGTSFNSMFSNCYSLQSVPLFNTSAGTNFSSMFSGCQSLQSVPLFNTSAGTNFSSMFNSCYSLQSVPLFDTSAVTNFSNTFLICYSLQSVPLFDTSVGTDFSGMLSGCTLLQSVPLFNTSAGTNFNSMFSGCYSLQSVSLFNTASGTNFSSMFYSCYSLQSVPLFNTASGTSFSGMFNGCYSLQSVPLFNTASGTNFSSMFYSCSSLQSVPLFNTASGTSFSTMFSGCYSLQSVPLFNTASGTSFNSMFSNCYSLQSVPLFNTSAGTNFSSMFSSCVALQAGRLAGTPQSISYTNCKLSAAALDEIYRGLNTVTAKTITVTGNWGTTGDDPTIATAKGWTVTG